MASLAILVFALWLWIGGWFQFDWNQTPTILNYCSFTESKRICKIFDEVNQRKFSFWLKYFCSKDLSRDPKISCTSYKDVCLQYHCNVVHNTKTLKLIHHSKTKRYVAKSSRNKNFKLNIFLSKLHSWFIYNGGHDRNIN